GGSRAAAARAPRSRAGADRPKSSKLYPRSLPGTGAEEPHAGERRLTPLHRGADQRLLERDRPLVQHRNDVTYVDLGAERQILRQARFQDRFAARRPREQILADAELPDQGKGGLSTVVERPVSFPLGHHPPRELPGARCVLEREVL